MPANTIHRNEEAEDGPAEGACVGLLMVLLSAEDPLLGFLPPPVEAGGRKPSGLSGCGSVFF